MSNKTHCALTRYKIPDFFSSLLGDSTPNSAESVESISQKTATMTLVTNAYATNFLDAKQRAEEFAVLGRLVSAVPVRKINAKRGTLRVEELCEVIQRDFGSLP